MPINTAGMNKVIETVYLIFKSVLFFPFRLIQKFPPWVIIIFKILFLLIGLIIFVYIFKNKDEWQTIKI